jgi:hypothetical protein
MAANDLSPASRRAQFERSTVPKSFSGGDQLDGGDEFAFSTIERSLLAAVMPIET